MKQTPPPPPPPPIEIPSNMLSADILDAVIESFILREGTDYGAIEVSMEKKMQQVKKQLDRKDIKVIFEPETETVTLMTEKEWAKQVKSY